MTSQKTKKRKISCIVFVVLIAPFSAFADGRGELLNSEINSINAILISRHSNFVSVPLSVRIILTREQTVFRGVFLFNSCI